MKTEKFQEEIKFLPNVTSVNIDEHRGIIKSAKVHVEDEISLQDLLKLTHMGLSSIKRSGNGITLNFGNTDDSERTVLIIHRQNSTLQIGLSGNPIESVKVIADSLKKSPQIASMLEMATITKNLI